MIKGRQLTDKEVTNFFYDNAYLTKPFKDKELYEIIYPFMAYSEIDDTSKEVILYATVDSEGIAQPNNNGYLYTMEVYDEGE